MVERSKRVVVGSKRGFMSVNQVRSEVWDFPGFDLPTPLVQSPSVHLPKLAAKLEILQHYLSLSLLQKVLC